LSGFCRDVIVREGGRSSIPSYRGYLKGRGVLDTPPSRGMTANGLWGMSSSAKADDPVFRAIAAISKSILDTPPSGGMTANGLWLDERGMMLNSG
jgi:hypothetical protein